MIERLLDRAELQPGFPGQVVHGAQALLGKADELLAAPTDIQMVDLVAVK